MLRLPETGQFFQEFTLLKRRKVRETSTKQLQLSSSTLQFHQLE
jgi:hypothetical protein